MFRSLMKLPDNTTYNDFHQVVQRVSYKLLSYTATDIPQATNHSKFKVTPIWGPQFWKYSNLRSTMTVSSMCSIQKKTFTYLYMHIDRSQKLDHRLSNQSCIIVPHLVSLILTVYIWVYMFDMSVHMKHETSLIHWLLNHRLL